MMRATMPFRVQRLKRERVALSAFLLRVCRSAFTRRVGGDKLCVALIAVFTSSGPFILRGPFSFR